VTKATPAERRLTFVLRAFGGLLLLAALVYAFGPLVEGDALRELPYVSNSVVKVSVLGLACLIAAGDVRRRSDLVGLVILAHVVSVVAMLVLLAFAEVGTPVHIFGGDVAVRTLLWGAIALDGGITAVIVVFWLMARGTRDAGPDPEPDLKPEERTLRTAAYVLAGLLLLAAVLYELGPLIHTTRGAFVQLPFVTNSVVMVSALALLSLYAARDMGRNMQLFGLVIFGLALSVVVQCIYALTVDLDRSLPIFGGTVRVVALLGAGIAIDALMLAVLIPLFGSAWRARYGLRYLSPLEYRTLAGVIEVVIAGPDEAISPGDVAQSMDRYLVRMRASRRYVYRLALFGIALRPLIAVLPPLPDVEPEQRRAWLKSRFDDPKLAPTLTRGGIRICQQMAYAGYYNDPRSFKSVGYTRFTQRARYPSLNVVQPGPHPLHVDPPSDATAEICIIGSGAGGSILAYELAKLGHDVLVLERGDYVEPREFSEDELEMIGRLYSDGVLQQTEDFRFTILQGDCVGGSTTVNNAVCFSPPPPRVKDWPVDAADLNASEQAVREFLQIAAQPEDITNPGDFVFLNGVRKLGLGIQAGVVSANIKGCYGSGYCNIGCRWNKKLSMLATALPWAQRDFPGRVRVMANCEVVRIRTLSGKPRRAIDVRARSHEGRDMTITADRFVLSAGALGSSMILKDSAIDGVPVGKHLCFNMGAPLTAELEQPLHSYDGLQISHYGLAQDYSYAYETWFNPPMAQAVNMPGWFEQHYENMRAYDRLMAVGTIVGTRTNAEVKGRGLIGPTISYTPDPGDLKTMAGALRQLAEILFAGGALRVMLNTWGFDEFKPGDDLAALERAVLKPNNLALGTGHPQGGNALSVDASSGVVDPTFRVHGFSNLYVCDASVFPSSLTVNPQLTVMTLAHYAAPRIAS
jgi:choline dehydrogenase-like flavoprotein